MFNPERLSFEELSERLREYEHKYGYSTIEFYRRFQDGQLGDDADMMMWAGLYHLYLTSHPIRQFTAAQARYQEGEHPATTITQRTEIRPEMQG